LSPVKQVGLEGAFPLASSPFYLFQCQSKSPASCLGFLADFPYFLFFGFFLFCFSFPLSLGFIAMLLFCFKTEIVIYFIQGNITKVNHFFEIKHATRKH
jgi:hypothetical protein